jgi:hypothetical protein
LGTSAAKPISKKAGSAIAPAAILFRSILRSVEHGVSVFFYHRAELAR